MAVNLLNQIGQVPTHWIGLSTDAKPTSVALGSTFYEEDTTTSYVLGGTGWVVDTRGGSGGTADVGTAIHEATSQNPPVDADEWGFWGSVSGLIRKCTWANIKATLKTYFDTLYALVVSTPATLADGTYILIKGRAVTYGETLAIGEYVYLAADGKVYKTDATDTAKLPNGPLIFRILTAGDADEQHTAMLEGYFRDDALAVGFSAGVRFYANPATTGGGTVMAPTVPGHLLQVLGAVTETAKICHFKPTGVTVTIGRYTIAAVDDYDLTTPIALANSLKTVMNAHAADAVEHTAADDVNFPVATAAASDITTLIALTTALLTAYDAHDADAEGAVPTYHTAQEAGDHSLASAVAPTTAGECVTRLLDLKAKYNAHDADATAHTTGSTHQEATADCVLAITPDIDSYSAFEFTAVDRNFTINEPTGTPVNMWSFVLAITDDGTPRTPTFNAIFNESTTITLPTVTVASEVLYLQFTYKLSTDKWNLTGAPGGY